MTRPDLKNGRIKQERNIAAMRMAREAAREQQLVQLYALACQIAELSGGKVQPTEPSHAWKVVQLNESHQISLYREGDLINIRGREGAKKYELNVSCRLQPTEVIKSIQKTSKTELKRAV